MSDTTEPQSIALDLGTTRIKGGVVQGGNLDDIVSVEAPTLTSSGLEWESDPEEYAAAAHGVLMKLLEATSADVRLGIASQRSSFVVWEKSTGTALTPLISWQDRRAEPWCDRHRGMDALIRRRSGLLLSPHYLGPKFAYLMEQDAAFHARVCRGDVCLGTLETYLVWKWSNAGAFQTDVTMGARTLLLDLQTLDWSTEALQLFQVPLDVLPRMVSTTGQDAKLSMGGVVSATIADQPSSALAVAREGEVVVNLGTGGFVLKLGVDVSALHEGYLTGPVLSTPGGRLIFAEEGTINGAGSAVDQYGRTSTMLPEVDPSPNAMCLPDMAGIGAPFWKAESNYTLDDGGYVLSQDDKRRVTLEGIIFRVRGIIEDLFPDVLPSRILVSGGVTKDPFVAPALAACMGQDVYCLEDREATLTGAGRLAAGLDPYDVPETITRTPGRDGQYLREKYKRWRTWLCDIV